MFVDNPVLKYRWDTFWTKEPETIAWIESFEPDSVFFDIGANIGVYSLYAGYLREENRITGLEIYAFEPMEANFKELGRNTKFNEFSGDWFHCFRFGVGSTIGKACLSVPDPQCGATGAQLCDNGGEEIRVETVDHLVETGFKAPDYVKIDIDGQESRVLAGMKKTLPKIRSVLVETQKKNFIPISVLMLSNGFTMVNEFNTMQPHSRERRKKEGIDAENLIFTRK